MAYSNIVDPPAIRPLLTAALTYYVRTDGNDSNDGLTDSAEGAFLTVQHAVDVVSTIDNGSNPVTIQLGDGTYVTDVVLLKNPVGAGNVYIKGNSGTPSNVVIDGGFTKNMPGNIFYLQDFKLIKSTSTYPVAIGTQYGAFIVFSGIEFGTGFTIHLNATSTSTLYANGNYVISGGCTYHAVAETHATILLDPITITLTGTPAFTVFAVVQNVGIIRTNATFSGSATGYRYVADSNAVINTFGAGASYLPGDAAGWTSNGGIYL
jgi:hypothetical protein